MHTHSKSPKCGFGVVLQFLSRSAKLEHDIGIGRVSVCPSACLSHSAIYKSSFARYLRKYVQCNKSITMVGRHHTVTR